MNRFLFWPNGSKLLIESKSNSFLFKNLQVLALSFLSVLFPQCPSKEIPGKLDFCGSQTSHTLYLKVLLKLCLLYKTDIPGWVFYPLSTLLVLLGVLIFSIVLHYLYITDLPLKRETRLLFMYLLTTLLNDHTHTNIYT